MAVNQIGSSLRSTAFPPLVYTLHTGQSSLIPSGQWLVNLGPYTVVQWYDSVSQIWRPVQTPSQSDMMMVSSDGINWRVTNVSGTVTGAYVVNGGTNIVLPVGIYPAGTAATGSYVTATTTAGGQSSVVGTAATFNVVVGGAISTTVSVTTAGTGYTRAPLLVFSQPPAGGVQASGYVSALSGGGISTVVVTNQGAGYTSAPTITVIPNPIDAATASGAVLTPSLDATYTSGSNGRITAVTVASGGSGYTSAPTITIASNASTTGVSVTAVMALSVTAVSAVSGGSNLTTGTGMASFVSAPLASAKTNAPVNPAIEGGSYTPRAGNGFITIAAGAATAVGVTDGGLHQTATVGLAPAVQWTTAAPATMPTGTLAFGGNLDTVVLSPF